LTITTTLRLLLTVFILAAMAASGASVEAASISVTWNAPSTNADGSRLTDLAAYRIYLGTSSPACPSGSFHTVSSSTTTPASGETVSASIAALTAGTTYFARVTAIDSNGNQSACSPTASGVAKADFTVTPAGSIAFGSTALNTALDRTFTVQNTSGGSVSGSASVSAPFSIVSGGSFSLNPGGTQTVTVRFRPTISGNFAGNVTFTVGSDSASRGVSGSGAPGATATLSVTKSGTGAGTVTSSPGGVACGTDCTETVVVGTRVTLTATANAGSVFTGWSGACSGTAACVVTVNAATTVTAAFNGSPVSSPPPPPPGVPNAPANLSVAQKVADTTGVTFMVTWPTASGATSYSYGAAFVDGTHQQQGTVTSPSLQLKMPYYDTGAATMAYVCVRSKNAAGQQSTGQACGQAPIPQRPSASSTPPAPVVSGLSPSSATAKSAALTLTVNGSGFVATSVVRWNGSSRTTTFVSSGQLRAAITAADLATARSVPVAVVTPAPGGGTSGSVTFTVTAASAPPPPPSPPPPSLPPAPPAPSVTKGASDASGVTFTVSWSAVSGATSYRWAAAFNDGSAPQQGTVTTRTIQLRMPYHSSGAASGAVVCIRSVNAAGQSATQSCTPVPVPARPAAQAPKPAAPTPPPPPPEYGWGVG
jgi:hypothetical protein